MAVIPHPSSIQLFTISKRRSSSELPLDLCEHDAGTTAKLAGLRYVCDSEPGIRRTFVRKRFSYQDTDGTRVTDERTLARIQAIVIPPAWTDVWICNHANGHLQATGRDDRGRKQYRYHPHWRTVRDEAKYGRMLQFGRALPTIRKRVDADLSQTGLTRDKVLATVVRLLELTLIRVGNEEYARTNESYGLTTLQDDHVELSGSRIRFVFQGKSGKKHEIGLLDARLAKVVRRCRELPGQSLFQYRDDSGDLHAIGSADVNTYLRDVTGQEFTAKDFRTWFGSVLAASELRQTEIPNSERDQARVVNAAITNVANSLGNTPAICRKCYVHPVVIDAFLDGSMAETASTIRVNSEQAVHLHSRDERLVLRLLESAV